MNLWSQLAQRPFIPPWIGQSRVHRLEDEAAPIMGRPRLSPIKPWTLIRPGTPTERAMLSLPADHFWQLPEQPQ